MRNRYSRSARAVMGLGAIAVLMAACTDLTELPRTEITEETFNPLPRDVAAMVSPAYIPVRTMWMQWYGGLDWSEEASDHFVTPVRPNGWYDGGIYIRNMHHRWTESDGQHIRWFNQQYSGINAANRVYYQIMSGLVPIADQAFKDRILAELRALRAYYYYNLVITHGNVAIVRDFADPELPPQHTRQEVFNFVVSELEEVIPRLSTETGAAMYGRLNQWAAKALLARAYLNAEVIVGQPMYEKVLPLTQDIIASGRYQLEPNYKAPFLRTNNTSVEILWHAPQDEVYATGSNFHMKTLKPDLRFVFGMRAQPWGGSAANPQFVATYDPDDTRKQDTWLMGPQFDDQGRGYDFVAHIPSVSSGGFGTPEYNRFDNGYPVWKYEIYEGMTGSSSVDYPVIRYAEVLLMRAEALLRTGDHAGAAALVTQVRQRAFASTNPAKATVTGPELLQGSVYNYGYYDVDGVVKNGPGGTPTFDGGAGIQYGRFLDELGWELAIEGHRRMQLLRWGIFLSHQWMNRPGPSESHRNLYPIPEAVLATNPNYKQNPGY